MKGIFRKWSKHQKPSENHTPLNEQSTSQQNIPFSHTFQPSTTTTTTPTLTPTSTPQIEPRKSLQGPRRSLQMSFSDTCPDEQGINRCIDKTKQIVEKFSQISKPGWAALSDGLRVIVEEWSIIVKWVGVVLKHDTQHYAVLIATSGLPRCIDNPSEELALWTKMSLDANHSDAPPQTIVEWCSKSGVGEAVHSSMKNSEGTTIGWLISVCTMDQRFLNSKFRPELDRVAQVFRSAFVKPNAIKSAYLLADMYTESNLNEVIKMVLVLIEEHCPQLHFSFGFISSNWKTATLFCCPPNGELTFDQISTEFGVIGQCITMKCVVAVEDFSQDRWSEVPQDVRFISKMLQINIRKSRLLLMPFLIRGRTLGGLYVMSTNQEEDLDDLKAKLSSILVFIAAQFYDVITVKFADTWKKLVSHDNDKFMSHNLGKQLSSPSCEVLKPLSSEKRSGEGQEVSCPGPVICSLLLNKESRHRHSSQLIPSPKEVFEQGDSRISSEDLQLNFLQRTDSLQNRRSVSNTPQQTLQQVEINLPPQMSDPTQQTTGLQEGPSVIVNKIQIEQSQTQIRQTPTYMSYNLQETTNLVTSPQIINQQQNSVTDQLPRPPWLPNLLNRPLHQASSSHFQRATQVDVQSDYNVYIDNNNFVDEQQKVSQQKVKDFLRRQSNTDASLDYLIRPEAEEVKSTRLNFFNDNCILPLSSEFEVSVEFDVDDDMIRNGGTIKADLPIDLIQQKIYEQHRLDQQDFQKPSCTTLPQCQLVPQRVDGQKVSSSVTLDHEISSQPIINPRLRQQVASQKVQSPIQQHGIDPLCSTQSQQVAEFYSRSLAQSGQQQLFQQQREGSVSDPLTYAAEDCLLSQQIKSQINKQSSSCKVGGIASSDAYSQAVVGFDLNKKAQMQAQSGLLNLGSAFQNLEAETRAQLLQQPNTGLMQPSSLSTRQLSLQSAQFKYETNSIQQPTTLLKESNFQQRSSCDLGTLKAKNTAFEISKIGSNDNENSKQEGLTSIPTQQQEDPKTPFNLQIDKQQQQQQSDLCSESCAVGKNEVQEKGENFLQTCKQSDLLLKEKSEKGQQSWGVLGADEEGCSVQLKRQRSSDACYYPKTFTRCVFFQYFLDKRLERIYRRWYNEAQQVSDVFYRCMTIVFCLAMVGQAVSCQKSQVVLSNILATTLLEGVVLVCQFCHQEIYLEYRSIILGVLRVVRTAGCDILPLSDDDENMISFSRMAQYGLQLPVLTLTMQDMPYIQDVTHVVQITLLVFYIGPIVCVRSFSTLHFFTSLLRFIFVQVWLGVALTLGLSRYLDNRERKAFLLQVYNIGVNRQAGKGQSNSLTGTKKNI